MTHMRIDPDTFVDRALRGLTLAYGDLVRRVDGGVVRARPLPDGHVALVIGGGSGHYPAFAGTVGPGMAAGAVCGQVFTSPSADQAYRVAAEAQAGGGVLFSFGNYAGDVMHFGRAQERLREEGIDCRTVLVTDDVASAPVEAKHERRGIAGDHVVFKIAGAAAQRGDSLDEVERLARLANDRTVSMGVAYSGCTLPGADEPLFTVPEGMISVGLGIHGEPGVRDEPMPDAAGLAGVLARPLLDERPAHHDGAVAVLLNGLGAVKYEELFVLYGEIHDLLAASGLDIAYADVGEIVTSLDMGGVSLTVVWLDHELEPLWAAPCETPAYRVPAAGEDAGAHAGRSRHTAGTPTDAPHSDLSPSRAVSTSSRAEGEQAVVSEVAVRCLATAVETLRAKARELGELDAIAGDGDHGSGMVRGASEALEAARACDGPVDEVLAAAGQAWADRAGGTSGALWGEGLQVLGRSLGPAAATSTADVARAVRAAVEAIARLGGAQTGDKTMLDAMVPYADALDAAAAAGLDLPAALARGASVAAAAAAQTAELSPRKGRARPLAERSVGHADPGATSFAMLAAAVVSPEGVTP
ncbi:dihydroxyacetone kinase family protein [Demequina sp. NBRC 110053]|uniref:dihydroxyacetone kinase family protein n=1 Tax=Demequina sp. NBRC 110053 TaxID=1570342 RepID=UPI000A02872D|nr:dihydroxyacetone kinase family protein [Demequina sp. NBRC 110053]